jgi:NADPH-dependent 2,4-dienoyl-CoA reductase/sulfur reductase-like enzyme
MAAWYGQYGAELITGARVAAIEPGAVVLAGGRRIPAGAVVVGIGARPATGLLAGSGIELGPDGAVVADEWLRASAPDVYAVGDCASYPSGRYGQRLLVHHWDNALQDLGPYDPVPYFWSEQFGRFVQYAGHHGAADTLLWRGDPAEETWSVLWLRGGALVALLAVGRPRDLAQGRKLIVSGAALDPVRATDPSVPLKAAAQSP